jgi:hypothetical protein
VSLKKLDVPERLVEGIIGLRKRAW